jgi:DNA adenine methylase
MTVDKQVDKHMATAAIAHPLRPFLKWAGGKRQLLGAIVPRLPANYRTYYEPFLGAGALLLHLQPARAIVNDINPELINCYQVIQSQPQELIAELDKLKQQNNPEFYYQIRSWDRQIAYQGLTAPRRAARLIFLNRTCYNGLYRVNSKGEFNVPFGNYKQLHLPDPELINALHGYLRRVKILCTDFKLAVETATAGDLIYFDPPYDPVSPTASFTSYSRGGFGPREQERLKQLVDDLSNRGCFVLVSNACTEFIRELYRGYCQRRVTASRAINSKASDRGKINELLIANYPLGE